MPAPFRTLFAVLALLVILGPQSAQAEARQWWLGGLIGPASAETAPTHTEPAADTLPDYEEWDRIAEQTEALIEDAATPSATIEQSREAVAAWREGFQAAQASNKPRIDTLREQIAALGPAPADGGTEPDEIAQRRKDLTEQITRAQAPGLAAEEAYRRADGLIREADTILRARGTHALMRRDPAPSNPANWPGAMASLAHFGQDLATELRQSWSDLRRRDALTQEMPALLVMLALVALLLWQGRQWIERLIRRLQNRLPIGWWGVLELPLSLLQVILPVAALAVMTRGLQQTGFLGPLTGAIATDGFMAAGVMASIALWIGWHIFPDDDRLTQVLVLPAERRAEGRLHVALFALIAAAEAMFSAAFTVHDYGATVNIIAFPLTVMTGILLFRLGQLINRGAANEAEANEAPSFRAVILSLVGKAAMAIGIIGPVIGSAGYIGLADALVRPAMETLGMLSLLVLLQRLTYDVYALMARVDQARARDALPPVLISFALVLAALPLLALIWGVRPAELWEIWVRAREGFPLGATRISPTDFLIFIAIFGIGYGLTKLLQSALKSAILPKTRLDTGGRNAIVAGTGYVGIVLAAFAAISATGLDLSSLAIVAGALSVGVGFGLQNIVQNFVSGIILLIERPVAEGDWVDVGGVQGIVRGISIRSTRVETFDRTSVIVPNASLISSSVTNYTGFNLAGRLIIPISVGYNSDTRHVDTVLREIAEAQPMVVLNPPPTILFTGFGADGLNFEIRAILRDINFSGTVRSEINHCIAKRFAEEGIEIPYAQREVRIVNADDLKILPPEVKAAAAAGGAV